MILVIKVCFKYRLNTNVLGNVIDFLLAEKELNRFELSLNDKIANGVYFISIKTSEGLINSKFIKQ